MTALAPNAIRHPDRLPVPAAEDRALLLDQLRGALDEIQADPSRHLALLLIRVAPSGTHGPRGRDGRIALRERLRSAVRSKAGRGRRDSVAWLGGDEFAVLTAPLNRIHDAERIAQRLLALLETAWAGERACPPCRAAVGIVGLRPGHTSPKQVLAEARRGAAQAAREGAAWRRLT